MMGTSVALGDVKTWYDEHGEGPPLVLVHGGIALTHSVAMYDALANATRRRTVTPVG